MTAPLPAGGRGRAARGSGVLALLVFCSFSLAVYQRITLTPNSPPHLMGRLIMDGPGRDYLTTVCPGADGLVMFTYTAAQALIAAGMATA